MADILAGIKENSSNTFELNAFPNPASKSINLTFKLTNTNNVKLEVLSLTGQKVKETSLNSNLVVGKNEAKIDIDGLANGIYYLKITANNLSQTVKFIVIN